MNAQRLLNWLTIAGLSLLAILIGGPTAMQAARGPLAPTTDVCGPIAGNTTWALAASPYVVTCDVTVNTGVTLTIQPGVVVKFDSWTDNLIVDGRLVAQGTVSQPIVFTSLRDDAHGGDTNGDGTATSPAPNDWAGIALTASSSGSVLEHTWIGYGGYGDIPYAHANVHLYTSDVTIRDNVIAQSGDRGIHVAGVDPAHPLELTVNTFLSNTKWAVYANPTGELVDVTLTDNSSVGSDYNGFGIMGAISGTVTYSSTADFPFIVWSDVAVQEGAELTLVPGAVVKFESWTDNLIVDGRLVAQGTASQPIVFTSLKDDVHGGDANGDGSATSPAPNDWAGIALTASSSGSVLEHTWIGYAGYGDIPYAHANVHLYTSDVTIRDNVIAQSGDRGIHVAGVDTAHPLELTANTFLSNTKWAVYANPTGELVDVTLTDNSSVGSDYNGFGIMGAISGTVTYSSTADFPFIVWSDVAVQEGAELTLVPGTVVKFDSWTDNLIVDGRLVAQGTASQPIVFTSLKDDAHGGDTNGDGSATSPAPSDWAGIAFTASSSGSVLEHTWIGYGGYGDIPYAYANVHLYTSDVTIRDNVIAQSGDRGIHVAGVDTAHPLELTANTFLSNTKWAVYANPTGELVDVTLTDNSSVGSDYNGFGIMGAISGTVTYSSTADFPFIVWSDVAVQEGAELTLVPGTVVKFDSWTDNLIVDGRLVAQGTASQPIVFTSLKDDAHGGDTNGDGTATSPAPNDWAGIALTASSSGSVLEHTWIGYGGYGDIPYAHANVHVYTDSVTIRDNVIAWSSKRGIYVNNASPAIERNTIYGNEVGVRADQGAQPVLRENAITGNSQYGVYNGDASVTIDAANNYWGSSTGPYHATANPFGEGNQVGDHILFVPWLEYPTAGVFSMDDVIVNVLGGVWFHPGEVTSIRISYANLTTQTVESAVLVSGLPYAAYYVESTGGGIHWPERNQVFWKLGDIVPGAAGEMWVTLRYMWGLPAEYHDASMAIIGGTNIYTDIIDVASYLAYVPVEITDKTRLTEGHVQAERQQHPDLETFYTQAIAEGYVFGDAARFDLGSTEPVTQTILLNPDTRAALYLTIEGDQVLSSTFKAGSYAVQDTSGGMTWDLQTDHKVYWGTWAPSTGLQSACGPSGGGCCLRNCMGGVLVDATAGRLSKTLELIMKAKTCYQALQSGEPDQLADCATELTDKIPIAGEIKGATKCIAQCVGDPNSNDCEKNKITCEKGLWYRFVHWAAEEDSYRIYHCEAGCYTWYENILCATGTQKCVPGKGCVDCTDKRGRVVDCHKNQFNRAKDPNAKYGPQGNLLPGQMVTYTITYENEGAGQAEGVFVMDELSQHFDVSTLTIHGGGEFYTGTRMLSWYVGSLAPKGEPGSTGAVSFTVQLKDDLPGGTVISNQAVVHFPSVPEVTPTNLVVNVIEPVVAMPQSLQTEAGQPIAITLQGMEISGLPLTYTVVEEPMYGQLTGIAPTLVYTSMANFTGPDYFTFQASNGITESEPAEVSILVNPWSGDVTPPEVSWTDPQDAAVVAEISATPAYTDTVGPAYAPFILVQFSEAISATTLTTETVQVVGDGGPPISITVLYDEMLARAVVIPRQPLQDDTRYEVNVSQGVKDLMGNPMAADYTWHFDVGSVVEPVAGLSVVNDGPTQLGSATAFTATVSAGSNVSYTWAFGDGATGSGAVTLHTYQAVGPHTAVVTASNSVNALVTTTSVTITDVPIAGLSAVNDGPTQLGDATAFTATVSAGSNVNYAWAFGDGATGSGAVTTHTYPEAKVYTATVTATNSINTLIKTTLVSISTPYHYIYLPLVLR